MNLNTLMSSNLREKQPDVLITKQTKSRVHLAHTNKASANAKAFSLYISAKL